MVLAIGIRHYRINEICIGEVLLFPIYPGALRTVVRSRRIELSYDDCRSSSVTVLHCLVESVFETICRFSCVDKTGVIQQSKFGRSTVHLYNTRSVVRVYGPVRTFVSRVTPGSFLLPVAIFRIQHIEESGSKFLHREKLVIGNIQTPSENFNICSGQDFYLSSDTLHGNFHFFRFFRNAIALDTDIFLGNLNECLFLAIRIDIVRAGHQKIVSLCNVCNSHTANNGIKVIVS